MGSCGAGAADSEWPDGVTGRDAEVGALVWVRRRNGSWWPGQILSADELPENCVVPPRSSGTPIKLLGRPDGSMSVHTHLLPPSSSSNPLSLFLLIALLLFLSLC
jgi:hypothetical protein